MELEFLEREWKREREGEIFWRQKLRERRRHLYRERKYSEFESVLDKKKTHVFSKKLIKLN